MTKKRGRPPGRTARGEETEQRLYDVAIRLFTEGSYEATTMRAIAREADVSVALLYRYFPSKAAVVTRLYDELSTTLAAEVEDLPTGPWTGRYDATLTASLQTLHPHRDVLRAVMPTMLVDSDVGLFSALGAAGRQRVRGCFLAAVAGATDRPVAPVADALGRLLDLAQLGMILFWLLDRSPDQRATEALLTLGRGLLPMLSTVLWLPGSDTSVLALADTLDAGLYG